MFYVFCFKHQIIVVVVIINTMIILITVKIIIRVSAKFLSTKYTYEVKIQRQA